MSGNIVDLVSDSEVETSFSSIIGISPDSHLPLISSNHLELEIVHLFDDSDSQRVYGKSLDEGTFSFGSLEAFISNVSR